jgi:hypothetical protein
MEYMTKMTLVQSYSLAQFNGCPDTDGDEFKIVKMLVQKLLV